MANARNSHQLSEDALYEAITTLSPESGEEQTWGEVWRFPSDSAGHGECSNLYWDFALPGGGHFSDPKWQVLYRSLQICVDAMFRRQGTTRAKRPGSVSSLSAHMRFFVRWMVIFDYTDLSYLDSTRFDDFVHWIELTKCRGQGEEQKSVTVTYAYSLLAFPAALFCKNEALENAGLPTIPVVPYDGKALTTIAQEIAKQENRGYQAVPDGLFIPTMNKVLEWLQLQIDEVQQAIDCYIKPYAQELSPATQAQRRREAMAKLQFSRDRGSGQPWFIGFGVPVTRVRRYAHDKSRRGKEVRLNAGHAIRDLLNAARDCCSIALQGCVAMRISEVCGLTVTGKQSKAGWPSCVEIERSQSGMDELFFIVGTVFKDKEKPRPGRWLAGSRPFGSSYIPIPIQAIIKLERLYAPWRKMSGRQELILDFGNKVGLALAAKSVFPMMSGRLREGQKEWVKQYVDAPPEFDDWELSSHQWRKAFARFCIRVDRTLLPAISRHLHHISIKTTEQYYTGEDTEIRYLIREAAFELAADLLYNATHSQGQAAGKLMDEIPEVVEELSHHIDTNDENESRAFLRTTMETDNTWGWDMDWGGCLFRPEQAQCNLKTTVRKIIPIVPALDALGPFSSCNHCNNLIVLPRHLPFWRERRTKLLADRKANRKQSLSDIDFIVGHRLAQCNEIIRRIGRHPKS
jgi:hypothetical protein